MDGWLGDLGLAAVPEVLVLPPGNYRTAHKWSALVFSAALRRVLIVLASCMLAATGLFGVPSASADGTPALNYTIRVSHPDLAHAQNGDPLKITISGLPAGATADWTICPDPIPDNLVKIRPGPAVPEHDLLTRVSGQGYCVSFNDELSAREFAFVGGPRRRSATTGDLTFDVAIPRGSSTPRNVMGDPALTNLNPSNFFPWPNNPDKKQYSFTCDENHPCTWVLRISPPVGTVVVDQSIKFSAAAPGIKIQGCRGIESSTFNASAPERFAQTLVGWNQLLCAPTRAAQPTNIVSETEDAALASFDTGDSDIAVTGSGDALAARHARARAYVPVGLNAAVVAAVGWSPTDRSDIGDALTAKLTDNLKFSWDDLANMLSKGGLSPENSGRGGIFRDDSTLVQRNAALALIHMYDGSYPNGPAKRAGSLDVNSGFLGVTGEAGKGSVPLLMSSMIAQHAPNSWVYGQFSGLNGPIAGGGRPVGTVTDLNDLNLGEVLNVHNVDAKTGLLNIRKQVNNMTMGSGADCSGGCLNWVVTDLATATKYRWTPVALPDGRGGYVAPTAQSLQAAATHFTQAADGSLRPGDTSGDQNAYPLTFAESIAAPLNPLVDSNCHPEETKQAGLTTLLRAATNGGQQALAPGLVPLTPELLGTAQDNAAKVGTGTGGCHEHPTAPGGANPGAGTNTPTSPGSTSPASTSPTSTPSGQTPNNGTPPKASTPTTMADAQKVAASTQIPIFPGAGPLGKLGPLLAVMVLVVVPSATAYLMAGRPAPPWLIRILRQGGNYLARLAARVRRFRLRTTGGNA